ncbi:hypothetical protein [Spirosoma aerolatum]|uniref:hypothetical protein n=1 Tax=Spirosoma aerolatum TaxID=1211326 RepID=UPI0009AD7931|nr:hypothetical protein [Spirosoma aerolatum]
MYRDDFDRRAFAELMDAVVRKCFDHPLNSPLSEPESKHLSTEIEERTGLVIGWRSIKNYTAFVLNPSTGKQENPSIATLDTLARYVLDAPTTNEVERKKAGESFSYWFRYREQIGTPTLIKTANTKPKRSGDGWLVVVLVLIVLVLGYLFFHQANLEQIQEDFHNTSDAYLSQNGWTVQHKNESYWKRRNESSGRLTLFTLKGDNWPKSGETPRVQNLLIREIRNDCFRTEIHMTDFVPGGNWQQAGLLLMEDTLFTGKSIRLSLSYNDFFGGLKRPAEILIQAISSYGKADANLEEFIHQPLFHISNAEDRRIADTNLKNVAFRIEKQGRKFRILYSASPVDNFSFKELTTYEFGMAPNYIGLFALKGYVDSTAIAPVKIRYFRLDGQLCN